MKTFVSNLIRICLYDLTFHLKQSSMRNNICLGCRTYFEEGERVPLENMFIEFKNYYLPLKESKQRWILLKTLTGFLNSKGGTIYIGVQDKLGQVIGLELNRKQQDEFQLFVKGFLQKIKPNVDLVNRQEISIVYVPVVTNKVFKGKYVIKIIVKQGDPAKTYHFAQKIELESKNKLEEFEIYHAFYRHNMGGIVEMRGEALLQQIARKAASPNQISTTFHKFCNPDPLKLDSPITKIGFSGIRREELRTKLQQIFHNNLQSLDIEYELTFDIQNQVLLIQLENSEQFKQINKFIKQKLQQFNQQGFNFIEKGQYLDFYLYKNMAGIRQISPSASRESRSRGQSPSSPTTLKKNATITKEDADKQKLQIPDKLTDNNSSQAEQVWDYVIGEDEKSSPVKTDKDKKKGDKAAANNNKMDKELCYKVLQKEFILTITHINSEQKDALQDFLNQLINEKYKVVFDRYVHTLELRFENRETVMAFHQILQKNNSKLAQFGVQGNLVVGINMKKIRISNYDRNKRKQLELYVKNKLKDDVEEVQYKKSNNKFFLQCNFKSRQLACQWLDQLLTDGQMKQFIMPGAEMGKASKLRIYIYCICS